MARLTLIDLEEARELHALAFPADPWPGDDHTFWSARIDGALAGLCSAYHWEDKGVVFLSRAAVVKRYQGRGVQQQMIRHRIRWARRHGVPAAITYTTLDNYPSIVALLNCGFQFHQPPVAERFAGAAKHYFRRDLRCQL